MGYINKLYWKARNRLVEEPENPQSKWYHKGKKFIAIGENGQPIPVGEDGKIISGRRIAKVKYKTKAGVLAGLGLFGILTLGCSNDLEEKVERKIESGKVERVDKSKSSVEKISQNGIELIKKYEGFREDVYKCPAGKDTIGYGHLILGGEKYNKITKEKAEELLRADINFAESAVRRQVKVPLTQNQYDALVSFVYNLGEGNFSRSTLLKKLKSEDYDGTAKEILRWNKANGKVLNGLVKRRNEERELFLKDVQ